MKPKTIFGLFVVLAAVQLAVPLGQIARYEDILRSGAVYKFRTAPIDPHDAFRGRYVALRFADSEARVGEGGKFDRRSPAYVTLKMDDHGFARFGDLADAPPAEGDYLRVRYLGMRQDGDVDARFRLPFDRFYMEESVAPRAETAYRENRPRRGEKVDGVYVVVRVKGGRGVIEDLYIKNKPIRDYLAGESGAR